MSESIREAGVLCLGVYVSMYAYEVRQGGSEPCLFVAYKKDEKLRDRTRTFVSITWRSGNMASVFLPFMT